MDVTVNAQPLLDIIAGAFEAAGSDVLAKIQAGEVHRTGVLAAGYQLSEPKDDGRWWWIYVRNSVRYALPVERGAWVKSGRGPHMRGNFRVKKIALATYGAAMKAALPQGLKPRRRFMRPVQNTVIR